MPAWVSDGSVRKYNRAVEQLRKENVTRRALGQAEVEATEEAVKALYVKWGGLLLGESESVLGVPEGEEGEMLERAESTQPERAPVKKAKSK